MSEWQPLELLGTIPLYLFCKKITKNYKIFLKEVQNRVAKFFNMVKLCRLDVLKGVPQENIKSQEI